MLFIEKRAYPFEYQDTNEVINYSFSIEEETIINEKSIKNRYVQEFEVELLSKEYMKGFDFKVNIKNCDYRLDVSLKSQENLIRQLNSLTEEMLFKVDMQGVIIEVVNYNDILEKWKRLKTKLISKNKGVLAQGYIDAVGAKIENKNLFISDLCQYRMFGFLFNGMLDISFYDDVKIRRNRVHKNTIHSIPIYVEEQVQLMNENIAEETITYCLTADLTPLEVKTKERLGLFFNYYGMPSSHVYLEQYLGDYVLNKHTAIVQKATLNIALSNAKGYKRTIKYKLHRNN
ncbi:MAG: hypothetical protein JKY08_07950 [Flavobacteriaceae bacterium]|nr:hypothetical protein [Flavobacteriaceae bacterium]